MSMKILAIDDEPHMLKLLERIINEKTSYAITTLNNSLEIEKVLSQTQFDLIISDLKMPGRDGLDILKFIKEKDRPEEVIIITAFGSMDSATKAISLGAFDYITKPFKKEQIIQTIDRAMTCHCTKNKARKWQEIMDIKPFDKAHDKFEIEYVKHLAEEVDSTPEKIATETGFPIEKVNIILKME